MKATISNLFIRTCFLLGSYGCLLAASLYLAYALRFDFIVPTEAQRVLWEVMAWIVPFKLVLMFAFGQFRGMLSYFRLPDLYRIFWSMAAASAFLLYLYYIFDGRGVPPRGVILIDFLLSVISLSSYRVMLRIYRERYSGAQPDVAKAKRVAIVGAGDAGSQIAADLLARRGLAMRPVLFFDDDRSKHGLYIHGIPVFRTPPDFIKIKAEYRIHRLILAIPSGSAKRIRELIDAANNAGLDVELVPSLRELATGKVKANSVRPVELQDLLGRDPVELDTEQIADMIDNKVVMVTGGGGSIGGELCRQIASLNPSRLLIAEQCEVQLFKIEQDLIAGNYGANISPLIANILDEARMRLIFKRFKPQIIFHAAAHKHVPMMESQPGEAIKNNALGTYRLARMAQEFGVERFILISSDKAINPTNVMGASKRVAEIAVQSLQNVADNKTRFMAVRFGNVLGSSGSVIPVFKTQIAAGGPVTVTHPEVTRYFMTIPEAVALVLQSSSQGEGGEIFVLDMGEPIKIIDVARQLIHLSGFRPDKDIEIKIVGLRPGEKLYEELRHSGEDFAETSHPRVFRFVCQAKPVAEVEAAMKELASKIHVLERSELKQLLKKYVQEYTPYLD